MAHDHHHDHAEEARAFYTDQLCTIGICGALGGVIVMMYHRGLLKEPLALTPGFQTSALLAGIGLILLVSVRAIALWVAVGKTKSGHTHGPDCCHDHDHADCNHDHDHADSGTAHEHGPEFTAAHHEGHEHGWSPIRYTLLLIPIVLYFLNLPNEGFSAGHIRGKMVQELGQINFENIEDRGGDVIDTNVEELGNVAPFEARRLELQGRTVRIRGMFFQDSDFNANLVQQKRACCAADAIPYHVAIVSQERLPAGLKPEDWVEVEGQVQFRQPKNRPKQFVPVIQIKNPACIKKIEKPANPYLE